MEATEFQNLVEFVMGAVVAGLLVVVTVAEAEAVVVVAVAVSRVLAMCNCGCSQKDGGFLC